MNILLTDDMKDFVKHKVKSGQYSSEQAMIEAALKRLRDLDESARAAPTLDDLIDHDFVEYCEREADATGTIEEILEATSVINDSMSRVIIQEERADRF
jgi:putative addiction module CopG family antidote